MAKPGQERGEKVRANNGKKLRAYQLINIYELLECVIIVSHADFHQELRTKKSLSTFIHGPLRGLPFGGAGQVPMKCLWAMTRAGKKNISTNGRVGFFMHFLSTAI